MDSILQATARRLSYICTALLCACTATLYVCTPPTPRALQGATWTAACGVKLPGPQARVRISDKRYAPLAAFLVRAVSHALPTASRLPRPARCARCARLPLRFRRRTAGTLCAAASVLLQLLATQHCRATRRPCFSVLCVGDGSAHGKVAHGNTKHSTL